MKHQLLILPIILFGIFLASCGPCEHHCPRDCSGENYDYENNYGRTSHNIGNAYDIENIDNVDKSLSIHQEIEPYLDLFIEDAKKHGFDYSMVYDLDDITLTNFRERGLMGLTNIWYDWDNRRGRIQMDEEFYMRDDSLEFRAVLYHEIGHWYGLEHEDCFIMHGHGFYYEVDNEKLHANWESHLEEFFTLLKS